MVIANYSLKQVSWMGEGLNPLIHISSTPTEANFFIIDDKGGKWVTKKKVTPDITAWNIDAYGLPVKFLFSKAGYKPFEFTIKDEDIIGWEVDLHATLEPEVPEEVPPEEKPWYIRFLDWTEKQLTENISVNPIVVAGRLSVMLNNILPEKWKAEVIEMPDWLQELGLWILFAPAFTTAAEGLVKEGATTAEANRILELLRTNTLPKALDIIKRNPTKYTKAFLALDDLAKSQILKGMQKDFLAKPALKVFNDALMKEIVTGKGFAGLLTVIKKPKTILWGLSGILGTIGTAYGISFGTEWFAKEGLWELYSFPLSDKMRRYRTEPTPELLEIIKKDVAKLREVAPKAQALIRGIAWLWPFTRDAWLEYADGLDFELKQIEDELAGLPVPEATGTLIIRPTPSDAKVSVEGEIPTTGIFSKELPIGTYSWTVSKFGFVSESGSVEIKEGITEELNIEIPPAVAPPPLETKLIINVVPEDAEVSVAGEPEITSAGTYTLDSGSYTIDFKKEGYEDERRTVFLDEGKTETVSVIMKEISPVIPPEELKGSLTISAEPEDAIIEIAGQPEIITPGTYELAAGSYSVRASKEGFVSQTKTAYVSEKRDTVVSFILEEVETPPELPTKATIKIVSEPTNSDIYIDGAYTFTKTPYTTILDAGTYIIRVQTDGFFPQEASVTVGEGDEIIVPFVLEEIPEPELPVVEYLPQEPWFPEYVPLTYYTPVIETTPYSQVSLPSYPLLDLPSFRIAPKPTVPTTIEKEILINIETTDLKPWKGKIFSIAWLDLSMPEAEPQVIVDVNEEEIIKAFMEIFERERFTKIVGFKIIFDYRFIFNKLMLYRMQSKAFHDAELKDVKQLLDQVKEAFVYFPDKTGTLNDYGKELLGIGKYGTQETLLRRYVAGDTDYVERFQLQQIQVTKGLYDLFRFSSAEGFIPSIEASQSTIPGEAIPQPSSIPQSPPPKKCPNCLAEQPAGAEFCDICKTKL